VNVTVGSPATKEGGQDLQRQSIKSSGITLELSGERRLPVSQAVRITVRRSSAGANG
jgi:hypothetical protein